jgi:hypothetical protein
LASERGARIMRTSLRSMWRSSAVAESPGRRDALTPPRDVGEAIDGAEFQPGDVVADRLDPPAGQAVDQHQAGSRSSLVGSAPELVAAARVMLLWRSCTRQHADLTSGDGQWFAGAGCGAKAPARNGHASVSRDGLRARQPAP